jgi:hypothetical protein
MALEKSSVTVIEIKYTEVNKFPKKNVQLMRVRDGVKRGRATYREWIEQGAGSNFASLPIPYI